MCLDSCIEIIPMHAGARNFVFSTFDFSVGKSTCDGAANTRSLDRAFARALHDPGVNAVVMTPLGVRDEFLGWAVALADYLVYAYVRYDYRRRRIIGLPLGTMLIKHVVPKPVIPCALWTQDASDMAAAGFPLRYDLRARAAFTALER